MKFDLTLSFIFLALSYQNCYKDQNRLPDAAIPVCIQKKIDTIKAEPKWNPPAEVREYLYNGRRVFLFSSDCCDQFNQLYDSACQIICAPSGGFTGKGDNRCVDFLATAKEVRLVWKDDRK